jgi:hypothetical protein
MKTMIIKKPVKLAFGQPIILVDVAIELLRIPIGDTVVILN